MRGPVTVGVLSFHNSKETKAICNAITDLGHEARWLRAENLTVDTVTGLAPDVDIVINRLLLPSMDRPLTALGLVSAIEAEVPVLNPADAVLRSTHKFSAASHLANGDHPVPAAALRVGAGRLTGLSPGGTTADAAATETRVFKHPIGTHGDATELLPPQETPPQLQPAAQGIVQELVEPPGETHEDVRAYVVGDELIGAMRRHAADGDWRTNVARGGRVRDATPTLSESTLQLARDVVAELGLDVAGVDMIEGVDGWSILEVNVTAGFKGFFEAIGTSPAPHIAKLAIEEAGGDVDESTVTELAGRLDDSVPECKPPLDKPPDPGEAVIGYTENVQVGGKHGSQSVTAKADTGATRSSIDIGLAGDIGAGPILDHKSVKGGDDSSPRPIVPVTIRTKEHVHEVEANVRDRSHLSHDVLLGRDVLDHYDVRVNRRHDDDPEPSYERSTDVADE